MRIFLSFLVAAGILDTAFLSYTHLIGSAACGKGSGCHEVLNSPYSEVFGLPLSTLGMGAYFVLAFCVWKWDRPEKEKSFLPWIFLVSLLANLAAPFLLYIQAYLLGAWCPFCLFSTCVMAVIFLGILGYWRKNRFPLTRAPHGVTDLLSMAVLFVIPSLLFLGGAQAIRGLPSKASSGPFTSSTQVAAQWEERRITLEEIDKGIRPKIMDLQDQLFKERLRWLEAQLLELEAARQNIPLAKLVRQNVDEKIEVTDEDIQKFLEENPARVPEADMDKARKDVESFLWREKGKALFKDFLAVLKKKYKFQHDLPTPNRVAIQSNPRSGPETGPTDAKVTIVEFSDFECSFCKKAHGKIKEMLEKYKGTVRLVFRYYPLESHEHSRPAAYAAICAHQQGKFWPFADLLFEEQGRMKTVPMEKLMLEHAERAGLDKDLFQSCLDSGKGKKMVEADAEEGGQYGVDSTPSFFVNGYFISGFEPEEIKRIIEKELSE